MPLACTVGKAGARLEFEVRIPVWLRSSGPARWGHFSVNEKDEASPREPFLREMLNAFIPRLPESEGFLFSGSALVSVV